MAIIKADLNAAEIRVAALLANDEPWLAALAAGESPHDQTASALFGRACGKESEERTFAKGFVFRWLYTHPDKAPSMDGGELRIYRVSVSPHMLQLYGERLNQAHPAIVAYKRQQLAQLHATALTRNAWGRYRDLSWALKSGDDRWVAHAENVALNHPIQTAIGEHVDICLLRVHAALRTEQLRAQLIAQRHDELVVEVFKGDVAATVLCMRLQMEQPVAELGGAVLPVDFEVGETWGMTRPFKVEARI